MSRSLLQFLKEVHQLHFRFLSGALKPAHAPIYVVGNPSADLDSIISAIVYSYFAHLRTPAHSPRSHIPLLNLPTVPSGPELYRLRPEFVKALWLCTNNPHIAESEKWEETPESAGRILQEHILTVNDFAAHLRSYGYGKGDNETKLCADITMVDWNAMPIRIQRGEGCLTGLEDVTFSVVGCIDHHVDEEFAPPLEAGSPYIIQPAGSCASLVVDWLKSTGIWQKQNDGNEYQTKAAVETQLASLALTPILVDTANLTAESKVTETDRDAVTFLSPIINKNQGDQTQGIQNELYSQINETKKNSLDLLTIPEILDRDFKSWTETSPSGEKLHIGFCSVVKSIPWIVRKADHGQSLLDSLTSFSRERELDIVVIMTAFSSKEDKFCRELLVYALRGGKAVDVVDSFVTDASEQLGLQGWVSLGEDVEQFDEQQIRSTFSGDKGDRRRLWVQTDVSKSRKQVAPLLRGAVGQA
ncbi:exopolyphosphatase [Aspergillus sclerotialis]|uniref:Exopolyphosphatase n=1 Tax=Aspergillus sclerotialis TaxID=2070753 RepID=A0A3A2ZSN4_9EURO|nr:exopolyphosphatase [Aspergillus sclerotialis]